VKVSILSVGGVKGPLASVIGEYEDRARHYWRFSIREVSAGAGKAKKINGEAVKVAEEVRLLECLSSDAVVVALTRDGKGLGSRDLASFLEEKAVRSAPEIVFVIGGAFGLGDRILKKASLRLSLSTMTLPHEVARLVLAEQLYRAGSILRNEPYHKGP